MELDFPHTTPKKDPTLDAFIQAEAAHQKLYQERKKTGDALEEARKAYCDAHALYQPYDYAYWIRHRNHTYKEPRLVKIQQAEACFSEPEKQEGLFIHYYVECYDKRGNPVTGLGSSEMVRENDLEKIDPENVAQLFAFTVRRYFYLDEQVTVHAITLEAARNKAHAVELKSFSVYGIKEDDKRVFAEGEDPNRDH